MPNSSKHANDITFTEESLVGFVKKIHNNIGDNYHFVSTSDMAEARSKNTNYVFTDYEKEIEDAFPSSNTDIGWNKGNIAKICIINNEFAKITPLNSDENRNSGRYTWVRGGSLLKFETEITGKTKDNRPNGTIWIDENNGTTLHAVKIKGFDDSGNFDNSNANPAKGTNGAASIASDILYAYKQLGTNNNPVPQAYITNLGSSNKPVNKAYIKDLYITDNGKIYGTPEFSGALTITDTTEATRIVPDSYVAQTPPDNYFNITNSGIRLTSTDQTYYVSLASGGYEAANTSTVYPSGTTFYTRSDNYSGGGNWAPPVGGYYYTVASPSTTVVNSSKIFKNNSYASQYYTKSGNTYTVCDTSTNYLNVQLYYGSGADPALGKNWSSSMALTGSIVTRGGIAAGKSIKGYRVHAAVFNDYAEYRQTNSTAPGRCVIEVGDGNMILSSTRLQPGANIVSDTFGFSIGETPLAQTPIAVCGRVLAYPAEDKEIYEPGDAVCSGPDGTVSKMTREEIKEWPDRIVGYVSEIPTYEYWGSDKVEVNGRIWIKIK